jgi:hypothetical protein
MKPSHCSTFPENKDGVSGLVKNPQHHLSRGGQPESAKRYHEARETGNDKAENRIGFSAEQRVDSPGYSKNGDSWEISQATNNLTLHPNMMTARHHITSANTGYLHSNTSGTYFDARYTSVPPRGAEASRSFETSRGTIPLSQRKIDNWLETDLAGKYSSPYNFNPPVPPLAPALRGSIPNDGLTTVLALPNRIWTPSYGSENQHVDWPVGKFSTAWREHIQRNTAAWDGGGKCLTEDMTRRTEPDNHMGTTSLWTERQKTTERRGTGARDAVMEAEQEDLVAPGEELEIPENLSWMLSFVAGIR